MRPLRGFIFLILLSFALETFAYLPREGNVTAVFGPYIYRTNYENSRLNMLSPWRGGFGLQANGDISDVGALEIGFYYMQKTFFMERFGKIIAEETELLHSTMGYRRWLLPWLSASLTLFSSYSIGEPRTVRNDFGAGKEPWTSAHDLTEYGLDFSVQTELWSQDRWAVLIDTRYSWSGTAKQGESADHYGAILAFRYFVQEKQVVDGPRP